MLANKRILFISPRFFNYEKEVKSMLENLGASVDFFDERPKNNFITKVIIRLHLKGFIRKVINNYYNQILESIKKETYDYVFVVSPETITTRIMGEIRASQKQAQFILYMWDSVKNKRADHLFGFFDKLITFDDNDYKHYTGFQFIPLYYIPLYEQVAKRSGSLDYDLCLIATAHSDRYSIKKTVAAQSMKLNLRFYSFLYLSSKALFWARKIIDKHFRFSQMNEFSFNSLTQLEIIEIIAKSKVVIDINHPEQFGLTNRTLEAVGACKKLITTNQNVIKYDFYNPRNIQVVDRNNIVIDANFINSEYVPLEQGIYEKYSLKSWLENIFDDNFKTKYLITEK